MGCASCASSSHRPLTTREVAGAEDGTTARTEQMGEARRFTALVVGFWRSCRLGTDRSGPRRRFSRGVFDGKKVDREANWP